LLPTCYQHKPHQGDSEGHLAEAASFTFRLKETEDIPLTNGSFDVADNAAVLILTLADQINAHLGDTTTRASTAEALGNTSIFNLFLILQKPGQQPVLRIRSKKSPLCIANPMDGCKEVG
jgi:hypothetical protein